MNQTQQTQQINRISFGSSDSESSQKENVQNNFSKNLPLFNGIYYEKDEPLRPAGQPQPKSYLRLEENDPY